MGEKIMCSNLVSRVLILAWLLAMTTAQTVASQNNYKDALSKCLLFFEGQRSGKLPPLQRLAWRKDSALKDGSDIGVSFSLKIGTRLYIGSLIYNSSCGNCFCFFFFVSSMKKYYCSSSIGYKLTI